MELTLNPQRTIKAKGWEEYIELLPYYDGRVTDSEVLVMTYPPNNLLNRVLRFVQAIERNSDTISYIFREDCIIDYCDNMVYDDPMYYAPNVVYTYHDIIGKAQFDSGNATFKDVEDDYINDPEKVLPNWVKLPDEWVEYEDRVDDIQNFYKEISENFDMVLVRLGVVDYHIFLRKII
jgi:hypothetical protein